MKSTYFEVLSADEIEKIHATSMEILGGVGVRVDLKRARDDFRKAGADVDEGDRSGVTRDFASVQGAFSGRVEADRRLRRADGEALWARVTLAPVRDPSGEIIHLLCLVYRIANGINNGLD